MNEAHKPIVDVAVEVITKSDLIVRDLGCGDGTLLQKISSKCPWITPTGCDVDEKAIVDARFKMPWGHFEHKNMWDGAIWGADLLILMPGRIIEFGTARGRAKYLLNNAAPKLLFYAYDEWLKKPINNRLFLNLVREAGFRWEPPWEMASYKTGNRSAAVAFVK